MHRSFDIILLLVILIVFLAYGCRTVTPAKGGGQEAREAQEALTAVAGALSGKALSEEDMRDLGEQLRDNEEAQTAVKAITGSVSGKTSIIKYCPITGKRYAPHMEICPEHGVPLKVVEP